MTSGQAEMPQNHMSRNISKANVSIRFWFTAELLRFHSAVCRFDLASFITTTNRQTSGPTGLVIFRPAESDSGGSFCRRLYEDSDLKSERASCLVRSPRGQFDPVPSTLRLGTRVQGEMTTV